MSKRISITYLFGNTLNHDVLRFDYLATYFINIKDSAVTSAVLQQQWCKIN